MSEAQKATVEWYRKAKADAVRRGDWGAVRSLTPKLREAEAILDRMSG